MAFSSLTAPSNAPSSAKRRYHSVSPFYLYCKEFVDECGKKKRYFRTEKQGFEAAALKWNTLSTEEKKNWRDKVREEKRKCTEDGTMIKLKMKNGDRGDPNCDPSELGLLKDLNLKRRLDLASLTNRWTWIYSEKNGIRNEHFLFVTSTSDTHDGIFALAIIEFSLGKGIIDEYHANFGSISRDLKSNARYEMIRRVLNWPGKMNRQLGDAAPVFFAPSDQLSIVFDALTYVDHMKMAGSNWGDSSKQLSLVKDLASISDLVNALRCWFKANESKNELDKFGENIDNTCCLTMGRQCVRNILEEFSMQ